MLSFVTNWGQFDLVLSYLEQLNYFYTQQLAEPEYGHGQAQQSISGITLVFFIFAIGAKCQ